MPDDCQPRPCAEIPPLPLGVGLSLIRAGRAHRGYAGSMLAEIGLHPGQEVMLFALAGGDMTPRQIAARLGVEPPTVTKMIRRMEAAGLVESSASEIDRRSRTVRLSAAGREAVRLADDVWLRLEAATTAGLTAAERDHLQRLLDTVTEALQAAGAADCHAD